MKKIFGIMLLLIAVVLTLHQVFAFTMLGGMMRRYAATGVELSIAMKIFITMAMSFRAYWFITVPTILFLLAASFALILIKEEQETKVLPEA